MPSSPVGTKSFLCISLLGTPVNIIVGCFVVGRTENIITTTADPTLFFAKKNSMIWFDFYKKSRNIYMIKQTQKGI